KLPDHLRPHQMRLFQAATGCQSTHRVSSLERRHTDCTLPDGHGNRFSRIPCRFLDALLPFGRWNEPHIFIGKIDSGLSPQTHHCGVSIDSLDAELFADVIKENVAGIDDCLMQTDNTVATRFPACE